jgi:hypothetical protein
VQLALACAVARAANQAASTHGARRIAAMLNIRSDSYRREAFADVKRGAELSRKAG